MTVWSGSAESDDLINGDVVAVAAVVEEGAAVEVTFDDSGTAVMTGM